MTDLLSLAEECEKAAGARYELECRIAAAVGRPKSLAVPNYTASIDAALSLVPAITGRGRGCWWHMHGHGGSHGTGKELFIAEVILFTEGDGLKEFRGIANTAPIALVAAALRARGGAWGGVAWAGARMRG